MTNDYQHFVPRFLLRQFVSRDGKVAILNIDDKEVSRKPIKKFGGKVGFYDFKFIGSEGKTAEQLLGIVESDAARIVKKLLGTKSLTACTASHKTKLAKFIVVQSFRTHAFFAGLSEGTYTTKEALFSELWRSTPPLQKVLEDRDWFLMETENETPFLLGDHPVVLQNAENPNIGCQLGIDVRGVECFMPMSPTLTLWIPPQELTDEIVQGYERSAQIHRAIRKSAMAGIAAVPGEFELLRATQKALSSGYSIYKAKQSGQPIKAIQENMENANSLQILFAEKEVYSSDGVFDFAFRVIEKTPVFADVTKTSISLVWPRDTE